MGVLTGATSFCTDMVRDSYAVRLGEIRAAGTRVGIGVTEDKVGQPDVISGSWWVVPRGALEKTVVTEVKDEEKV